LRLSFEFAHQAGKLASAGHCGTNRLSPLKPLCKRGNRSASAPSLIDPRGANIGGEKKDRMAPNDTWIRRRPIVFIQRLTATWAAG
jgi:hypothetical protein